jgi:hypothetical protein
VAYKSSDNMNFREAQYPSFLVRNASGWSIAGEAESKQQALFADRPESRFVKAHPQAVIHPFYEAWVHELLDAVRLKLKRTQ